jgi:hypothetical protein
MMKGKDVGAVDGGQAMELYVRKHGSLGQEEPSWDCAGITMDVSRLVFYRCDLGPRNIIHTESKESGIIDWETAGLSALGVGEDQGLVPLVRYGLPGFEGRGSQVKMTE